MLRALWGPHSIASQVGRAFFDATETRLQIDLCSDVFKRQELGPELEYDVFESFAGVALGQHDELKAYSVLPIFPKRMFFHSSIYVDGHFQRSPADFNGLTIGLQSWSTTTAMWVKGFLADVYGLDLASCRWREQHPSPPSLRALKSFDVDALSASDLKEGLLSDEIDIAVSTEKLTSSARIDGIRPLFPDPMSEERDYFRQHQVFPIMHVLAARNATLSREPWLPQALLEAWVTSGRAFAQRLWNESEYTSLPWIRALIESVDLGGGVDALYEQGIGDSLNRRTVETLLRYCHEQEVIAEAPSIELLFHAAP